MIRNDADFQVPEAGLCGMRPTDSHEYSQLNELKIDMDFIREEQHIHDWGAVAMTEQMPIIGGFLPSVEAGCVSDVATTLAAFGMFGTSWHLDGPIHVRWGITTARETCQIAGFCGAACNRNTDLLLGNQYYTLAGPCTEMTLLETAVQAATDCASGRAIVSGVASAKGVALDKTTGMEARVMGETCMATCKMNVPKSNEVINAILAKYEPNYKAAAPPGSPYSGKMFAEGAYDPVKILPSDEYLAVYAKAMKTLEGCGLPLKGIY